MNSISPITAPKVQIAQPKAFQVVRFGGTNPNQPLFQPQQAANLGTVLDTFKTLMGVAAQKDLKGVNKQAQDVIAALKNLPQGSFGIENGQYVIDPFDGEAPISIPTDKRKVYGPGTDLKTFLSESFGTAPKLVICPVGWTVPDPDSVASINRGVAQKFQAQRSKAAQKAGADSGPAFDKEFTKLKKQVLKSYYETAFKQWWAPIQEELLKQVKKNGFNASEVCFLTSASYDGIDKAAIDFAKGSGMKIANITPYTYARWMNTDSADPLLVTNTISDYADACAAADVTLVTGGREHALGEDIARGLIGKKTAVIVADVLREAHGIEVPAWKEIAIENAAAYMNEQGFQVANMKLADNPANIPGLTSTQRDTVAVLGKLFNQINVG